MLDADIAILIQQDMKTLCHWWNELNWWRWPDEMPDPEPPEHISGSRRSQIMEWIMEAVG